MIWNSAPKCVPPTLKCSGDIFLLGRLTVSLDHDPALSYIAHDLDPALCRIARDQNGIALDIMQNFGPALCGRVRDKTLPANISAKFEIEFENILGCQSGA
jgi:hypothetical protein